MESQLTDFVWLRPTWLLALLPALLITWFVPLGASLTSPWEKICAPHLLSYLLQGKSSRESHLMTRLLLMMTLTLITFALAGPSFRVMQQEALSLQQDVVVALDMSAAMLDDDIAPNRLIRAKYKLNDLLSRAEEVNVGLVAYTKEAFVASPVTRDTETIIALLPALEHHIMPVGGSDVSAAITEALNLLPAGGTLLIVTASHIPDKALQLAEQAKKQGVVINLLALRDAADYQALAQAANGRVIHFKHDDSDVLALLAELKKQQHSRTEVLEESLSRRIDDGYYLLWFLLPLALPGFRRGWLEASLR